MSDNKFQEALRVVSEMEESPIYDRREVRISALETRFGQLEKVTQNNAQALASLQAEVGGITRILEGIADKVDTGRSTNWGWIFGGITVLISVTSGYATMLVSPVRDDAAANRIAIADLRMASDETHSKFAAVLMDRSGIIGDTVARLNLAQQLGIDNHKLIEVVQQQQKATQAQLDSLNDLVKDIDNRGSRRWTGEG